MRAPLLVAALTVASLAHAQVEPTDDALPAADGADASLADLDDAGLDDAGLDDAVLDDAGLDALLAGDEPAEADEDGEPSVLRSFRGFGEARGRVFLRDRDGPRNDEQLLLEAELELELRLHERVTASLRPRVLIDVLDDELRRFEPLEAHLTLDLDPLELRVGQLLEDWGIADTWNPIDLLNRRDLATDALDPDRLGELGARLRLALPGAGWLREPTLALYALPIFRPTPFAGPDSPYAIGAPFDEEAGFEPRGADRGLYAARFTAVLETAPVNLDLQLSVARGVTRRPLIAPLGAALAPVYYGAWTFGAGFRAVLNAAVAGSFLAKLTLKAEVAVTAPYRLADAPLDAPADSVAWVVGVDRAIAGVLRENDQLTLTLEYAREDGADDAAAEQRPFRDDLIARALWEVNDFSRTSLELRALIDLARPEVVVEARFARQLRFVHDDLQLVVAAQVFETVGDSPFGRSRDLTHVSAALRWDF